MDMFQAISVGNKGKYLIVSHKCSNSKTTQLDTIKLYDLEFHAVRGINCVFHKNFTILFENIISYMLQLFAEKFFKLFPKMRQNAKMKCPSVKVLSYIYGRTKKIFWEKQSY